MIKFALCFFILGASAPLAQGAQRVIALSPALVEVVFALGLEENLIGASDFSDYPEKAKELPSVGPYNKPSLEKIIQLKPDFVLLPMEGPDDVKRRFDQLKIKYVVVGMRTLDEIGTAAKQLASFFGVPQKGRDFERNWQAQMKERFKRRKNFSNMPPQVLIEVEQEPLIIAAQGTFLNEILEKCGGRNVFSKLKGYPRLFREALFDKKIDLILMADHFGNAQAKERAFKHWQDFLPTKDIRLRVLDPDTTIRPGPRLLFGIQAICEAL